VSTAPNSGSPEAEHDRRAGPLSTAWIADELLERTRRVWSRVYGRPIDEREAVEILMNVKRFAEVLLKAGSAENQP